MATYNNLVAQIKALVLTSSLVDPSHVYDYAATNVSGYPAIRIYPANGIGSFADTARNRRTYYITIQVLQERGEQGEDESERIMRLLVDDLIAIFDARANITLNNACNFARPIPAQWGFEGEEQPDVRVANILIECIAIA
jgi:hypothetical protein